MEEEEEQGQGQEGEQAEEQGEGYFQGQEEGSGGPDEGGWGYVSGVAEPLPDGDVLPEPVPEYEEPEPEHLYPIPPGQ